MLHWFRYGASMVDGRPVVTAQLRGVSGTRLHFRLETGWGDLLEVVQADTGPESDSAPIFVRWPAAPDILNYGREAYAEHGLLCAVAREQPAVDVVHRTVILRGGQRQLFEEVVVVWWNTTDQNRRLVRVDAHQEDGIDLIKRQRARKQSLAQHHADLLVDLSLYASRRPILAAVRHAVQAAHGVQKGRRSPELLAWLSVAYFADHEGTVPMPEE